MGKTLITIAFENLMNDLKKYFVVTNQKDSNNIFYLDSKNENENMYKMVIVGYNSYKTWIDLTLLIDYDEYKLCGLVFDNNDCWNLNAYLEINSWFKNIVINKSIPAKDCAKHIFDIYNRCIRKVQEEFLKKLY